MLCQSTILLNLPHDRIYYMFQSFEAETIVGSRAHCFTANTNSNPKSGWLVFEKIFFFSPKSHTSNAINL